MIDFHSHILPGMDDGAQDIETSLEMLRISAASGVETVVATSHCHLHDKEQGVTDFIKRRNEAYSVLTDAMKKDGGKFPSIILGAEIAVNPFMSKIKNLSELCIENTNYILLEMPYDTWADEIYDEIFSLTQSGMRPIMAHLDRFFNHEKHFDELYSLNILFQINASAFENKAMRRKILKLFENDAAHVIGSDMHNTSTRPPNIAAAYEIIEKKFGWEYVDFLKNNSSRILQNTEALPTRLPRLNFIKKILL